jgi:two-component system sensor histidine kinase DegS
MEVESPEIPELPPKQVQARRLVNQREADRRALAHALHDEAAQTLANVALHLQICERALAVDVDRGRAELTKARGAIGEAINRLRGQVFRLRPLTLEELGVGQTLRRYASTVPAREGLNVEVVDGLGVARFEAQTELGLYRIAQAALDNAVQHAGASQVVVELTPADRAVKLEIRDDGKGFDAPAALDALPRSERPSGLLTIAEWSAALGADLDVRSTSTGTTVRVLVPAS